MRLEEENEGIEDEEGDQETEGDEEDHPGPDYGEEDCNGVLDYQEETNRQVVLHFGVTVVGSVC